MAIRDSVLYDSVYVKKYISDARDGGGRVVPLAFAHTVVTGEASGDDVNLVVLPANCEVVALDIITNGLGATVQLQVGDSGAVARYMVATVLAATENFGRLAFAGQRFRPTANTVAFARYSVAAPTVGTIFRGAFWIVPGT